MQLATAANNIVATAGAAAAGVESAKDSKDAVHNGIAAWQPFRNAADLAKYLAKAGLRSDTPHLELTSNKWASKSPCACASACVPTPAMSTTTSLQ